MTTQAIDMSVDQKNRRLGIWLGILAVFMVCMAPVFYWTGSLICQELGLWTNPDNPEIISEGESKGRTIKAVFGATVDKSLKGDVEFEAVEQTQRVMVGDPSAGENSYRIRNISDRTLHIRPIHYVSPASASKAFQMTMCFCYNDMTLEPGESRDLVVAYGFQADLDRRVFEALVNYDLEPITSGELRPDREMPTEGMFQPDASSTRDLIRQPSTQVSP